VSSSPTGNNGERRSFWRRVRFLLIAAVLLFALVQRSCAAQELPVDADEPVYAWAASYYAGLMARGEWGAIPDYTFNIEHPAFVKLLFAATLRLVGYEGRTAQAVRPSAADAIAGWHDEPEELGIFLVDRYVSVIFGTLQVVALTIVNPLAGALLAIHTMTVKYTSQIYLEAVPAFAITASILAYDRVRRQGEGKTGIWFWLSAALLGVTASSKYIYVVPGLVMVPFIIWQHRRRPWNVLLFGLLALAVFFALNPVLWPDPIGRLRESILFHARYPASPEVARYDHAWWQPLNYMRGAAVWHPTVFWFPFDLFIFIASLIGLPFLFRRNPLAFAWYVAGWLFLFLWPTKWPQYTLIVVPAICLSVGALGSAVTDRFDIGLNEATWKKVSRYLPDETFWIAPPKWLLVAAAVLILLYAIGYVGVRINRIQQLQGWTTYTENEGLIVSDAVTSIAVDDRDRVWVGTQAGLTIYEGDTPTVVREGTSPLSDDQVTALVRDATGRMWVGTAAGVDVVEGGAWTSHTAADLGLPVIRVRALAADGAGGVWVGTTVGAAYWDGEGWETFDPTDSYLTSQSVLALTVDGEGRVWMGTERGLAVLDRSGSAPMWTAYTVATSPLTNNGIRALMTDRAGRVWVGTGGGGACRVAGDEWDCYKTSNSAIPWNSVTALMEDEEGRVWVATHRPTEIGGAVARFDGDQWQTFTPRNSGLASGAVAAMAEGPQGRYWFGTQFAGLSIYDKTEE